MISRCWRLNKYVLDYIYILRCRHGNMGDLRDPGSRKYYRIVEKFTKYVTNIPISSSTWTFKSKMNMLEVQKSLNGWSAVEYLKLGSILGPFCHKVLRKFIMIDNWVTESKQDFPCPQKSTPTISCIFPIFVPPVE